MNKEYTQINDTDYIVSSDNGMIDLVKANDNIEEILIKENEIEEANNNIVKNNKELKEVKFNEKSRKTLNILILLAGILMTLAGFSGSFGIIFGIIKSLVVATYASLIMKALITGIFGIKILNKRKIKNLTSSIENDSYKVETLTKELKELKAKSNYQKMPYSETHIAPMKQPTYGHSKNKVKRLVPNKDEVIS